MFIDRNVTKNTVRRSEERNVSMLVSVQLSSAPPNDYFVTVKLRTKPQSPLASTWILPTDFLAITMLA